MLPAVHRALPGNPAISRVPHAGFTLIELLIVILVIAIIAALATPTYLGVIGRADGARCASNLRQIGNGIILYAGEHEGLLPGPQWSVTAAMADDYSATPTELMVFLKPYLGPYPITSAFQWYSAVFECPAAKKVIQAQNKSLAGARYFLAPGYTTSTGVMVTPFGYPSSLSPIRMLSISSYSTTVALTDADQKNTPSYTGNRAMASAPVHGLYRNTLYFDGHVSPVAVQQTHP